MPNPELIELDDLVYTYPDITDPLYQQKFTAKKEYNILSSEPNEPVPKRGEFYNHQTLLHRRIMHQDNTLVIWSPGTGKSGGAGGIAEKMRSDTLNVVTDYVQEYIKPNTTHIKRVIFLVKNKTLKDQFKSEIVCKYSKKDTYRTEKILNALNKPAQTAQEMKGKEQSIKSNITRELHKYYQFKTYTKFAKNLYDKGYTKEDYEKEYSGTMFIVDEVHNLRIESDIETDDENLPSHIRYNKDEEKTKQQIKVYNTLWELFHSIKRSKIVLMTATPMINSPIEIGFIMNLILPAGSDNQMPVSKEDERFYSKATEEDLAKYFNGYISYVGKSDSFAIPRPQGQVMNETYNVRGIKVKSKMKIYPVKMMDKITLPDGTVYPGQAEVYQNVLNSSKESSFRIHERQISNFMFPDGTYGQNGVKKWIKNPTSDFYDPINELVSWISSNYLYYLSPKFYTTIKLTNESKGNTFVFSPFKIGSGAFLLGMCYRYFGGYEQFREKTSVFEGSSVNENRSGGVYSCLITDDDNGGNGDNTRNRISRRFEKKKRYAIITSGMSENEIEIILSTFNSWDNRYGEYIKCLIVTPIAREGINVSNVLTYINIGPGWNRALSFQAEHRVLRAISHVFLLEELKKKMIERGEDPSLAKIYVDIYNLAAVKDTGYKYTADVDMYRISENKDIIFKYIENIMQKTAFDCQINYSRNDITRKMNPYHELFESETSDCINPPPEKIDTSSYDILYSDNDINQIIEYIRDIYQDEFSLNINDLIEKVKGYSTKYPESYIIKALHKIIKNKMILTDNFGYYVYMKVYGDQVYISREYPLSEDTGINNDTILDYYSNNLITIYSQNISDYIEYYKSNENVALKDELSTLSINDPRWDQIFDDLSIEAKINLFEKSIENILYRDNKDISIDEKIFNKYREKYYYPIYEPTTLLEFVANKLSQRGKGRGRKPKADTIPTLKQLKIPDFGVPQVGEPGVSNEQIYVHTLYSISTERSSYNVSSKVGKITGKLRIYKPSEKSGWRDLTLYETLIYSEIINKMNSQQIDIFEQLPFYGIIAKNDGKFRIRNKIGESVAVNGRKRNRGRVASTYDIVDLSMFIWYLQIPLNPVQDENLVSLQDKQLFLYNKKVDRPSDPLYNFDENRINYYYRLYNKKLTRTAASKLIENELRSKGWLYIE